LKFLSHAPITDFRSSASIAIKDVPPTMNRRLKPSRTSETLVLLEAIHRIKPWGAIRNRSMRRRAIPKERAPR
jgi:hypothetical protein